MNHSPKDNSKYSQAEEQKQEITRLLNEWLSGNQDALEQLYPLIEDNLRQIAKARLSRERKNITVSTLDLMNSTLIKFMGKQQIQFENRRRFYSMVTQQMTRILVDHARKRKAAKIMQQSFDENMEDVHPGDTGFQLYEDILLVNQHLQYLESALPDYVEVVQLRFFGGLTVQEIAMVMETNITKVKRELAFAIAAIQEEQERKHSSQVNLE